MSGRMPDDDTREAASWLINLIQVVAVNDPNQFRAIEGAVREVVTEYRRQTIADRLERLNAQGLEALDALLTVMERTYRNDPPGSGV